MQFTKASIAHLLDLTVGQHRIEQLAAACCNWCLSSSTDLPQLPELVTKACYMSAIGKPAVTTSFAYMTVQLIDSRNGSTLPFSSYGTPCVLLDIGDALHGTCLVT